MGLAENGGLGKRSPRLRLSSSADGRSFYRSRSRIARFLLFEKVDYFQWIWTVAIFCFVVILFQAFLPGSVLEKSGNFGVSRRLAAFRELGIFSEIGELDFGEGIRFVPSKLLEKFEKEREEEIASSSSGLTGRRAGLVNPLLALILPDLSVDATNLHMLTVAVALKEIGYNIHVYALEDGNGRSTWSSVGFLVYMLSVEDKLQTAIDWLNYNCILVASLEAKPVLSTLLLEPFKSVPVIWTVHEDTLARRVNNYLFNNQSQIIHDWKQAFKRATVVVFPNHVYPLLYSTFDSGNFYVIPGSPAEAWEAKNYLSLNNAFDQRSEMGYDPDDFIIAVLGSQFSYSGLWLEQALVLQAIAPIRQKFSSASHLKVLILGGNFTDSYRSALEAFALKIGFLSGSVKHIGENGVAGNILGIADVAIYGSFLEVQSFPPLLNRVMCLGKPVIAPDLEAIAKHINDGVNGYIFPKKNVATITEILSQVISDQKLSSLADDVGLIGKERGKNLMVSESIEGYANLLQHVIKLSSETASPKTVTEIPTRLREKWVWYLFEDLVPAKGGDKERKIDQILDRIENHWNTTSAGSFGVGGAFSEVFSPINWAEEKILETLNTRKRLEEDELKDRVEQSHGTWEEVYRNSKKADRSRNEMRERDDKELERVGQPICIYEPYYGEGTWSFLHNKSLYRGIGLSSKGRRPGGDDIDATSRLPILGDHYYRNVLAEHGAFFALANRIDRIHKNTWIGFQSWRASARKALLSMKAETALIQAIESKRYGDALYFWTRIEENPRNSVKHNFWSFCDSINAGNCRSVVSEAFRRMYGVTNSVDFDPLPPMPADGDTWSATYCWALPTRSFLEYVMFSRMFVDALDAQNYDEHHQSGHCALSFSKDPNCYSRVMELLVNVWAYHSARRMVYIDPKTGEMEEQHMLTRRRGRMRIKWFILATLKSMDEDLAEESDVDRSDRRWLWPMTGEVYWQGVYEREKNMRMQQKERKKRESKDKIRRIKSRARQKTIGKYVKPESDSNSTTTEA